MIGASLLPMAADIIATKGNRIRATRYGKGMKVYELADSIGITASYLSAIERGRVNGSPAVLVRLASALGLTVADIIDDSPPAQQNAA